MLFQIFDNDRSALRDGTRQRVASLNAGTDQSVRPGSLHHRHRVAGRRRHQRRALHDGTTRRPRRVLSGWGRSGRIRSWRPHSGWISSHRIDRVGRCPVMLLRLAGFGMGRRRRRVGLSTVRVGRSLGRWHLLDELILVVAFLGHRQVQRAFGVARHAGPLPTEIAHRLLDLMESQSLARQTRTVLDVVLSDGSFTGMNQSHDGRWRVR